MFMAGWVHRDVSSGNVYWLQDRTMPNARGRGLLADLEYAKKFQISAQGSSDPKTVRVVFIMDADLYTE